MLYRLVGINPTRLKQSSVAGKNLNGKLPDKDPEVKAGCANWVNLNDGGLFNFREEPIVVENLSDATWAIVSKDNPTVAVRPTPTQTPFKLVAGEILKATDKESAMCIVRLDTQRIS